MAELAENLLSKIQSEAEAHNTALAALLKQSADQFAETQSMQLSSDRAAAAVEEYSAQQQGQEIAFSRTQQHLQQKTEAAIEKQSLTDNKTEY